MNRNAIFANCGSEIFLDSAKTFARASMHVIYSVYKQMDTRDSQPVNTHFRGNSRNNNASTRVFRLVVKTSCRGVQIGRQRSPRTDARPGLYGHKTQLINWKKRKYIDFYNPQVLTTISYNKTYNFTTRMYRVSSTFVTQPARLDILTVNNIRIHKYRSDYLRCCRHGISLYET